MGLAAAQPTRRAGRPARFRQALDDGNTRKTRLTLKDINKMRLASEQHDADQQEEAKFVQKMYGQPADTDNLEL